MNIGIDARVLIQQKTGIGYYLENLLISMLEADKENKYFLFSNNKISFDYKNYNNVVIVDSESGAEGGSSLAWDLFKFSKLVEKHKIDVFWGTQNRLPFGLKNKCKTMLTVHDLICFQAPETVRTRSRIFNQLIVPISIKSADKIVAVSKYTKKDIIERYGKEIDKNKIEVIYEDVKALELKDVEKYASKLFSKESKIELGKYVLYVGTMESRKNVETLLDAYGKIQDKTDLKLVLCGKMGWKGENIIEKIENHPHKENIIYLNYVTDEEKYLLMKNCFAFVFPSYYEGFGLPVIEAMKMDSIAIVANNSSLDELIEMPELKFETRSFEELAGKIINLYEDNKLYEASKEYCIKRAKDFNWNKFAKEYIKLLKELKR